MSQATRVRTQQPCNGIVVQRGQTLGQIGRTRGLSVQALAQANGIANANVVAAGRCLAIPSAASTAQTQARTVQVLETPKVGAGFPVTPDLLNIILGALVVLALVVHRVLAKKA